AAKASSASRSPSLRRGSSRQRGAWERCWPLFSPRKVSPAKARLTWAASLVLHGAVITLALTTAWRIDRHQSLITIIPPEAPRRTELPPFGGTKRGKGPSGGLGRPPAADLDHRSRGEDDRYRFTVHPRCRDQDPHAPARSATD